MCWEKGNDVEVLSRTINIWHRASHLIIHLVIRILVRFEFIICTTDFTRSLRGNAN